MDDQPRKSFNWRTYHRLLCEHGGDFGNVPKGLRNSVDMRNRDDTELASMMGQIAFKRFTERRDGRVVVVVGSAELKELALEMLGRGKTEVLPF